MRLIIKEFPRNLNVEERVTELDVQSGGFRRIKLLQDHIDDDSIHYTQSEISIDESQISDLDKYSVSEVDDFLDEKADLTSFNSHVDDSSIHFEQSDISIEESQVSDLDKYSQSEVDDLIDDFVGEAPEDDTQYVRIDGVWEPVDIEDLDWSNISGDQSVIDISGFNNDSGYITDYTVTEGDVTQYEDSIDHDALSNYNVEEHRVIDDSSVSSTSLWSSDKIDSELGEVVTDPAGSDGELQFNDDGAFGSNGELFWDNGNERLGVRTSSPSSALNVQGIIEASRSSTGAVVLANREDGLIGALQAGSNEVSFLVDDSANNGFQVLKQSRTKIEEGTASGATNLFTVTTAGRVGINTENPSRKLDVDGEAIFRGNTTVQNNLGIGTDNPSQKLTVEADTASHSSLYALFENVGSGAVEYELATNAGKIIWGLNGKRGGRIMSTLSGGDLGFSSRTGGNIVLSADPDGDDHHIVIKDDGKVGINTSNPSKALDVDGQAIIRGETEITGDGEGIILSSPDGTRYKVTVEDNGDLTTTQQ